MADASVDVALAGPKESQQDSETKEGRQELSKGRDASASIGASEDSEEYETLEEDNADSDPEGDPRDELDDEEELELELDDSNRDYEDEEDDDEEEDEGSVLSSDNNHPPDSDQRAQPDGQEEINKDKKLDHDEDRRDPQYIPKRGIFYEHDDRTNEVEEGADGENKAEETPRKGRVWQEPGDRWTHDMYNEDDQSPKTMQEIVDMYGYDIRNEESPPKARRRRRYGRGPTKYTRNWEDETAYVKKRGGSMGGGYRGGGGYKERREDFPSLEETGGGAHTPMSGVRPQRNDTVAPRGGRGRSRGTPNRQPGLLPRANRQFENSTAQHRPQPGRDPRERSRDRAQHEAKTSSPERAERPHRGTNFGLSGTGRGGFRGGRKLDSYGPPKVPQESQQAPAARPDAKTVVAVKTRDRNAEEDIAALSKQFSDAVINVDRDHVIPIRKSSRGASAPPTDKPSVAVEPKPQEPSSREGSAPLPGPPPQPQKQMTQQPPPRLQESTSSGNIPQQGVGAGQSGRSKRYSTQRQRSLPQSSHQQTGYPIQQQHYYHGGAPSGYPVPDSSAAVVAPPGPPAPVVPAQGNTAIHPVPPIVAFMPPPGPPPGPPYPPPPPQALVNVNYTPVPAFHPHVPISIPPPPVQGAEMFTGQGGITYYSTQNQVPRQGATSRRVKLAIPIVAPPSHQHDPNGPQENSSLPA